ncbi:hypothetical protein [Lysobacter gummosus]|uniref:hypothetical protein n=1 Tax=Lysobacter gummosus TaxID=262324 RepID=UPI003633F97F
MMGRFVAPGANPPRWGVAWPRGSSGAGPFCKGGSLTRPVGASGIDRRRPRPLHPPVLFPL